MITAVVIISLTIIYLVLGNLGMSKQDKERSKLRKFSKPPLVSIIIPAYNSSRTIGNTLNSVASLDYPRKEIIVVNDSKDNTPHIAKSYGARVIQNKKRIGKANALNIATRKAKGEFLFFIDSDTVVNHDSLSKMIPWFSKKRVGAVMPKYYLRERNRVSVLASLENLFQFTLLRVHMLFGKTVGFRGCSVVIRKSVLEKHPWPDTLMEDNYLGAVISKNGYRIIWEPRAVTRTSEPKTYKDLRSQKRRWGEGAFHSFRCNRKFYMTSPQFVLFFYPYFIFSIVLGFLIMSFILSPFFFPFLATPLLIELITITIFLYFHILIFVYVGGGELMPKQTVKFMFLFFPITTVSYTRGMFRGMRRKQSGKCELNFKDW